MAQRAKIFISTVVISLFGMIFLATPALSATSLLFSTLSVTTESEQSFDVAISIDPQGVKNFTTKVELTYQADLLEVTSFRFASGLISVIQPGYDLVDNTNGVLIKTAGFPGGTTEVKTLGTVSFRTKKDGNGTISVSGNSFSLDVNNEDVFSPSFPSVAVTVNPPEPTEPPQPLEPPEPAEVPEEPPQPPEPVEEPEGEPQPSELEEEPAEEPEAESIENSISELLNEEGKVIGYEGTVNIPHSVVDIFVDYSGDFERMESNERGEWQWLLPEDVEPGEHAILIRATHPSDDLKFVIDTKQLRVSSESLFDITIEAVEEVSPEEKKFPVVWVFAVVGAVVGVGFVWYVMKRRKRNL